MALTITHLKVNNIPDWTQADLDVQIAAGNFPPGTTIADITLAQDWNSNHVVSGTIDSGVVANSITQVAHGFSVGDLLYLSGGTYVLAMADDVVSAEVVGMVSAVTDADTFILASVGKVSGLAGLTAGTVYFLSPTVAGEMTSTQPSTVTQVVKPVFVADTTTSGYFINYRGELITPISGGVNLYIQDDQPVDSGKYLWIDTTGGDLNFWVEDGV